MEDRKLEAAESLALIGRMIENTRSRMVRNSGRPLLAWGYATVLTTLAVWGAVLYFQDPRWNYLWLMLPLLGWLLGVRFQAMIASLDHWIAFILLGIIGVNMIRESRECGEEPLNSSFSFRIMLPLAVATSIDALAVGVTFAFLQVDIVPAVLFIGCTTFVISAVGVKVGAVFGARFQHQAELLGGVVLVLMGIKILAEHLMGG